MTATTTTTKETRTKNPLRARERACLCSCMRWMTWALDAVCGNCSQDQPFETDVPKRNR